MDRDQLLSVIRDQHQQKISDSFVNRTVLDDWVRLRNVQDVIIISGVRRCGKSRLMVQIRQAYSHRDYFLNFDDDRLIHFELKHFQLLWELFIQEFGEQDTFYFDEIQNIKGWERFVRRLHDNQKKVIVTGSNAAMLSRELGTHLTGRYLQVTLFPLSYKELAQDQVQDLSDFKGPSTSKKGKLMRLFRDYQKDGGFPGYLQIKQPEYLKALYESILYRDVIVRYKLPNEIPIKELLYYVASNVGKEISFSRLSPLIGLSNPNTLKEYFGYLESVYLVFLIRCYDPSVRKQAIGPKKAYMIDVSLIRSIGFRASEDDGRILENIVFLELIRRGAEVFFHKLVKECDFLIRKGHHVEAAIQVSKTLLNPVTKAREISGLQEAIENYQLKSGLILTEDEEGTEKVVLSSGQKATVKITPIWKWLLS